MAKQSQFVQFVLDLLAGQDGISARAMFGGYGVYRRGVMFGLIASDVFYLKVDAENLADFELAGSSPFQYAGKKGGQPIQMSYWEAPPSAMERPAVMCEWAEKSQGAATRARAGKPAKKLAKKPNRKKSAAGETAKTPRKKPAKKATKVPSKKRPTKRS